MKTRPRATELPLPPTAGLDERLLRASLEAAPDGILVIDGSGRIAELNPRAAQLLGLGDRGEWLGRESRELVRALRRRASADTRRSLERCLLASPIPSSRAVELESGNAPPRSLVLSPRALTVDGEPCGRLVVMRDPAEEKRVETALQRTQRLEMIGTLSGGLAHDLNNQLTAILGNARFLQGEALGHDSREALGDVIRAASHCARLTRGLLTFSRRAAVEIETLDLAPLVEKVAEVFASSLPPGIVLDLSVDPDLPAVRGDAGQLEQVLLNLALNARDAVADSGVISLRVRADAPSCGEVESHVVLEVEDDGIGMSERVRERIFDPFFTTKGAAGTGLGLSVVHGIVEAHGGRLEVCSQPGFGSRFTVHLPAHAAGRATPRALPRLIDTADLVLVADDEAVLRRLVRRGLERHGYRVLEATDGLEALELFREHAEEIRFVLLDQTMPRLDGRQVVERLYRERPTLPIVLASGHFGEEHPRVPEPVELLNKPFSLETLLGILRRRLANDDSGESELPTGLFGVPRPKPPDRREPHA